MKKNSFICILFFIMLFSFTGRAEKIGISGFHTGDLPSKIQWYIDWANEHPKIDLSTHWSFCGAFKKTTDFIDSLTAKKAKYSVFQINTMYVDWEAGKSTGLMTDLSSSHVLSSFVDGMYPSLQSLAYKDNQLVGIPCNLLPDSSSGISVVMENWNEAGFAIEDIPSSFVEFLDFLDKWCSYCEENSQMEYTILGAMMFHHYSATSYTSWLTSLYINQYFNQCIMFDEDIDFSLDSSINIINTIKDIGDRLYLFDPAPSAKKYLINTSWNLYEIESSIPCRITTDYPMAIPVHAEILYIPSNTAKQGNAMLFAEHYINHIINSIFSHDAKDDEREFARSKSLLLTSDNNSELYAQLSNSFVLSHWDYSLESSKVVKRAIQKFAAGEIDALSLAQIINSNVHSN